MWEFRRDPATLEPEERQKLAQLFRKLPKLKKLYEFRLRFKAIFDRDWKHPWAAGQQILKLLLDATDVFPSMESFLGTYENWREEILNYFRDRQTSAGVEGINNKARVIIKRAYGLKSADSLWTRLILDLNRASEAIGWSIEQIRQMAQGLKALFDPSCT
jgi:transposase